MKSICFRIEPDFRPGCDLSACGNNRVMNACARLDVSSRQQHRVRNFGAVVNASAIRNHAAADLADSDPGSQGYSGVRGVARDLEELCHTDIGIEFGTF